MPASQHFIRIDTIQLKSQIKKKIGRLKTENYLDLLSRFLSSKLSKCDFDKLCIATVGKENIHLHNALLRGIIKNICLSKTPPGVEASLVSKKESNGFQTSNSFRSLCKDLPRSPRRTKDIKGKSQVTEVFSSGGRPPCSMEDGEEVDQSSTLTPGTHSENQPIEAPLGVSLSEKMTRQGMISRRMMSCSHLETCYSVGQLPDTVSLKKKLEQALGVDGVEVSVGFTNLLNMGLDVFLKRLIKPCLELSASRSSRGEIHRGLCSAMMPAAASNGLCSDRYGQETGAAVTASASMADFQVAMELNPSILGEDWPAKLDKSRLLAPGDV